MTVTPDEVLTMTALGGGFHQWRCEGGAIQLTTEELRPALEGAYDPSNPNWQTLIRWDDDRGLVIV